MRPSRTFSKNTNKKAAEHRSAAFSFFRHRRVLAVGPETGGYGIRPYGGGCGPMRASAPAGGDPRPSGRTHRSASAAAQRSACRLSVGADSISARIRPHPPPWQRQRKENARVSGTSPDPRIPQGRRVSRLPGRGARGKPAGSPSGSASGRSIPQNHFRQDMRLPKIL